MTDRKNKKLSETVDFVIETTKKYGASESSVTVSRDNTNRVVNRDGKWEQISGSTTAGLTLKIYRNNKYAVHSTSDLNEASLEKFIKDAVDLTGFLVKDPHRKLVDPSHYSGRISSIKSIYDAGYSSMTLEKRKALTVSAVEAATKKAGKNLISVNGTYGDNHTEFIMATSNGFSDSEKETGFYFYVDVSVKDRNGARPSDYEISTSHMISGLESPEKVGTEAALRALRACGAQKIKSGKYNIVVENRKVSSLLRGFLSPLYGSSVYNKTSCFEKSVNTKIASNLFSIIDSPHLPGGFGSRRFDSEGITTKKRDIVSSGVLKSFFFDSYYASKLGVPVTSGSKTNLVISPGKRSSSEIISSQDKVIFVTGFIGGNSNSTTGDFSHGMRGLLYEKGKLISPVIELNISGNHTNFWNNVLETSSDVYRLSSILSPAILFKDVTIAGI
ncbi:MAG: TldD/PmbA family protein [Deltaproteobacteria bacterium]|nr:TldD/PmbA family protein [Deltaproteobacteria bacterium]